MMGWQNREWGVHARMSSTIADVAREAGVSIATVSRVVNGTARVSPYTAEKVTEAIARLQYRPNHMARALPGGLADRVIGLVIPEITNPIFPEVAAAVERQARLFGFQVMLCQTGGDWDEEFRYTKLLIDRRVAGIIFVSGAFSHIKGRRDTYSIVREEKIPMVLVNSRAPDVDAPVVATDERQAGMLQAQLVLDGGAKRVAFLGGPMTYWVTRDRLKGVMEVMRGLQEAGALYFRKETGSFRYDDQHRMALSLLTGEDRADAVICASDLVAMAVLSAARDLGLWVPRDLQVVGFDGVSMGAHTGPPLTTVGQPLADMGRLAVDVVLGRRPGAVFAPRVIVRQSVRHVRASGGQDVVPGTTEASLSTDR